MSNIENIRAVETTKLAIKYGGNQVVEKRYKQRGGFTREQILGVTQRLSDSLKRLGFDGYVAASIKYPDDHGGGWRGGYSRTVGTRVHIYSYHDSAINIDEPESYPEFIIFTMKNATKIGKASKNNDCLYYAIKQVLRGDFIFKQPEQLKEFLKVDRKAGVHINKIPMLEKHLNIRINVLGDHIYTSVLKGHQEINLKLINGHYEVDKDKTYTTRGIAKSEKKPLIVSIDNKAYDGKKTRKITKEELTEIRKNPNSSEYIIIHRAYDDETSLEDIYDNFIKDAEILKKETMGVINMYKTGSDTKTASRFFEHFSRSYHTDNIQQNEAEYIDKASSGAIIFGESYTGPLYEYDVCSMYPSIMTDSHMLFPLKEGTWLKYTQKEFEERKFYVYGIYRCIIQPVKDKKINRLIRFNPNNLYTHFDLNTAKKLGFKIDMIEDEQPNLLYYPRDCLINGNTLFYKYVQMLYKLKERDVVGSRAKSILNKLWGVLTKKNTIEMIIKNNGEMTEIYDDRKLHMICPTKDGYYIEVLPNNKIFETNYARIKPFLLARGRKMIADLILPHNEHTVRTHTDSICSTIPLTFKESKYTLGSMVFKGYSKKATVKNSVFVNWGKFIKK